MELKDRGSHPSELDKISPCLMRISHLEQYLIVEMYKRYQYLDGKNEVFRLTLDYPGCFCISLIANHNADNVEAFFTGALS